MCKKYPGPKCGRHLLEERHKLELLTDAINAKVNNASEAMENFRRVLSGLVQQKDASQKDVEKARADYNKAIARHNSAQNSQRNHASRLRVNAIEYDNTLDGIADLESCIASLKAQGKSSTEEESRLAEAKDTYQKQVLAFDKVNGTVNFKKPAEKYDDSAIYELQDKIKAVEKKLTKASTEKLMTDSPDAEDKINARMVRLEKQKESLKDAISHCEETQERIRLGFLPDPLGAERLRKEAAHALQRAQESYERSDTEGFASQWASNSVADKNRLKAEIAENNGKSRFRALFDLSGKYVMAKEVNGKYGWTWGIYADPEDPDLFSGFVNESKSPDKQKQAALLLKKGYTMGLILAPAYVTSFGESLVSVRNIILQDFRRTNKDTVEVLTTNLYTHPVD